jgi:hypothetical protein
MSAIGGNSRRDVAAELEATLSEQRKPAVLFRSRREPALWGVTLLALLPVALAVLLLTLNAGAEDAAEFGDGIGVWLFRGSLALFSTTLFWPMVWLSGRYVLCAERLTDGRMSFTTWTLLEHRDRLWPGPSSSAPAIWFEGDCNGSGRMFQIRTLLRTLLQHLVGRRDRLWPGGPIAHEGRTHIPGRVWVDAPYLSLYPARGRRLIIDMQGEFPRGREALLEAIRL